MLQTHFTIQIPISGFLRRKNNVKVEQTFTGGLKTYFQTHIISRDLSRRSGNLNFKSRGNPPNHLKLEGKPYL